MDDVEQYCHDIKNKTLAACAEDSSLKVSAMRAFKNCAPVPVKTPTNYHDRMDVLERHAKIYAWITNERMGRPVRYQQEAEAICYAITRNIDWTVLCELHRWDRGPPLDFDRKGVARIHPTTLQHWRAPPSHLHPALSVVVQED